MSNIEREDCYGKYWEVIVESAFEPDPKYTVWLLNNIGFAGPNSWEWASIRWPWKSSTEVLTVQFRVEEDAVAFKLRFGL